MKVAYKPIELCGIPCVRMKVDMDKVFNKLRGRQLDKGRVSLYLDKAIWQQFKKYCDNRGKFSASEVLEEMISEALEDYAAHKPNYISAAEHSEVEDKKKNR